MGSTVSVPNIMLIIVLIVVPILVFIISFVFCCLYSSPLDAYQQIYHILPKGIVLFSLTLIGLIPLMLPFDVSNQTQYAGLDAVTPILWQILFSFVCFMVVIVLPFCIIYYESQNSSAASGLRGILRQCLCALIITGIITVIFALVVGISYIWLGYAEIPVKIITNAEYDVTLAGSADITDCTNCRAYFSQLLPQMSIVIYIVAWLSIVGWFIFVCCGGCGLSSLPINCVMFALTTRVRRIDMDVYKKCQKLLVQYSSDIINKGSEINETISKNAWIPSARRQREYNLYKEDAQRLYDDYKMVENAFKLGGTSIIKIIFQIIAGIIFALISVVWAVHIFLYQIWIPPIFPFLNSLLSVLEEYTFPIVAWSVYGFFVYYLLFCVLFGIIRVGANVPFISFYPLKYRDTLLNGFLVNCGIMLLASITVCQFCAASFSGYARYTSIDAMFNTYIANMVYLKYFFQYIHYFFFGMIFMGIFISIFELIYNKWIRPLWQRRGQKGETPHEQIMSLLGKKYL